jgi:mRNA interferase RelE/StbE
VTYALYLHPKAAKELKKIEAGIRERIIGRARELYRNPVGIGRHRSQSDFWSLRVGDYRVIYQIDHDKKQVVILFVGHRSKVYDDFMKML